MKKTTIEIKPVYGNPGNRTRMVAWTVAAFYLCICTPVPGRMQEQFEVGGPLQGVALPLYPTQHGEDPGYPGCLAELQNPEGKGYVPFTSEGLPPERQLYDGSVEHFRAYWFKYLPVKSSFDRQSLLRKWLAKEAPGVAASQVEEYAEPVYWVPRHREPRFTGKFNKPVPVVRCKPKAPVFSLDLGVLKPGMYCLRAVGAVETKALERHRKPVYLRLTVNDTQKGEETVYRVRCPYVDEFYRVAEFFFNAPEDRTYRATLSVDEDSLADLLVHTVELHDVLAGSDFRAIKSRAVFNPSTNGVDPVAYDDARRGRDEILWEAFPPLNAHTAIWQGMGGDDPVENWPDFGCAGLTGGQIEATYGRWQPTKMTASETGSITAVTSLMVNTQLNLTYRVADLRAGRPLPDPYPCKDTGCGLYTPASKEGSTPQNWYPVARGVQDRIVDYVATITARTAQFSSKADAAAGHDAALMLCRLAYHYPSIETSMALHSIVIQPGAYGRDQGSRRRDLRQYLVDVDILKDYDRLFPLIQADKGLAQSVGKFISWVKSPSDVVKLIDTYLVQAMAKRCMRYQMYNANDPTRIITPVTVLADNAFTAPWMEWLFSSTFVYPFPPSGLQDALITGNDRDGIGYIGSYMYALKEQTAPKAAALEDYLINGGNAKYDLRDPKRYPKPVAACYWYLNALSAGLYSPRIGDVSGPDRAYGVYFKGDDPQWRFGWRWTHDPVFAYVIFNHGKRGKETDAEWAAIEQSAATVKRAPWLETRSRVIINWFGLLESGVQFDDPRFRRNVYLRVGKGYGHAHLDTLDLQGHAHGFPFTIDGGQRSGYSVPNDAKTRVHNLVEVDGSDWSGHSWVETLSDNEGARYLSARAVPPRSHPQVSLYRRQVALIDVDEGGWTPDQPTTGLFSREIALPDSYVFDVVRVAGGKVHTYCFHGPVEDELVTNMKGTLAFAELKADDLLYLKNFGLDDKKSAGEAPEIVEATWRMIRGKTPGSEDRIAGNMLRDENSPRKYTRLHVLGQEGARMLTGASECKYRVFPYTFTSLFVQQRGDVEHDSVFPALIEPFVGEPFIASRRTLPVRENETDAQRAVALEVQTRNGHVDLLFADGRPDKVREVEGQEVPVRVAGEFAYCSTDKEGLRQATLVGGTLLQAPGVTLKVAARERRGNVIEVDYAGQSLILDQAWPEASLLARRPFEIGTPARMTTYTLASAKPEGQRTRITMTGGNQYYCSRVTSVKEDRRQVECVLPMPKTSKEDPRPLPGEDKNWIAANESLTRFWRAEYLGPSGGATVTATNTDSEAEGDAAPADNGASHYLFQLDGAVSEADFGKAGGFCLFEYGVGDAVRQSTSVSLRRVSAGTYELTADVPVEVTLGNSPSRQITLAELTRNGGVVHLTSANAWTGK